MKIIDTVQTYKCPNCGGPLRFDPDAGKLLCDSCGGQFDAGRELEATDHFDWGAYKQQLQQDHLENTRVYVCTACGAEIEADAATAATHCPYCDNNVVLSDKRSGGLKPNGVIPFRITPKQLPDVVKNFYKGKHLLPNNFFQKSKLDNIQGVYVPFWLYDCTAAGGMNFSGQVSTQYRDGKYDVHETKYYRLERDGRMRFVNIPVDGSKRMDDDLMDSVEPFDFSELRDFDSSYLAGYLAERFEDDPDDCLPRASTRLQNSAADVLRSTCSGYSAVTMERNGMRIESAAVRYVLLPVYVLNCSYAGKSYRFAVNGQTGKIVGDLPVSRGKSMGYFFGVMAGVAAVAFAVLQGVLG